MIDQLVIKKLKLKNDRWIEEWSSTIQKTIGVRRNVALSVDPKWRQNVILFI